MIGNSHAVYFNVNHNFRAYVDMDKWSGGRLAGFADNGGWGSNYPSVGLIILPEGPLCYNDFYPIKLKMLVVNVHTNSMYIIYAFD